VDDAFSHLLLADTLLHGRLANPTPVMWEHLEALEVNMKPTYASVYPPVQGMFLATGKLITGQPFSGVVLSVAVMCASICWMLQGWMEGEWALLGGLLAVVRFGTFTYWANSYMGGSPAAIGGALVMGALPRIWQDVRMRDAAILGIGVAVLANSRPYEGFLLTFVVGVALLYWLFQKRGAALRAAVERIVSPLAVVVAAAAVATGYYFWRVTGNPLRTPYEVNWETYGMMPKFIWQSLRPQTESGLRHPALRDFYYVWEFTAYASTRTFPGVLKVWAERLYQDWRFFLGPALSVPVFAAIVVAPYGFRWRQIDRGARFLILFVAVVAIGISVELFSFPHYAAPITGAILGLVMLATRYLRSQDRRSRTSGRALARVIPAICLLTLAIRAAAVPLHIPLTQSLLPSIFDGVHDDIPSRAVQAQLEETPGPQLVILQYSAGSNEWMGWVHNEADVDRAKIVWAWDMGEEKNRELVEYFRGRRVWIVNTGEKPPALRPYTEHAEQ
jgi:hypothetical protein